MTDAAPPSPRRVATTLAVLDWLSEREETTQIERAHIVSVRALLHVLVAMYASRQREPAKGGDDGE